MFINHRERVYTSTILGKSNLKLIYLFLQITLYSYEDDFQNTFEGFCPLNAVVNTKSGGYLFADFAGTNINTTPETNLTCECSTYGSKSIYCNDAEFCECKPGFDGPKCDNCISESTRPFCDGGFRDTSLFRIPKTPEGK